MQWQPIETAPKDGTVVLLAGCYNPVAAAWLEHEIDWWHVDDNKHGPFPLRGPSPTHWMPLPNPPEQATCRWWRDEYGNWCCACSDTMPDFTPWKGTDPNGWHCPKCGKVIATKVHDKP